MLNKICTGLLIVLFAINIFLMFYLSIFNKEIKSQEEKIEELKNQIDDLQKLFNDITIGFIVDSCVRYKVPISVGLGVCYVESGNRNVIHLNKDGSTDHGRMQVNSNYHDVQGKTDRQLIEMGIKELRRLHNKHKDWFLAVFYYHAGYQYNVSQEALLYVKNVFSFGG